MTTNEAIRFVNAALEHGATQLSVDIEHDLLWCNKPLPDNVLAALTVVPMLQERP